MSAPIPRVAYEDLAPRLAEALKPRVERLGYLGEFFRCMAHQPEALLDFVRFTEHARGGLPDNLAELVALTVASKAGNAYERNQHERLSIRLGLGRAWITAVEALDPDGEPRRALSDTERILQRFVIATVDRHGQGVGDLLAEVLGALGHERTVAAMLVVGRYLTHALIVNALELRPPVPSIFEDGFDG